MLDGCASIFERHSRSLCIAELGSLDLDPCVPTFGLIADFTTNVLSFTITIGPDEQGLAVFGLIPNIFCNWQLVLQLTVNIIEPRRAEALSKPCQRPHSQELRIIQRVDKTASPCTGVQNPGL